MIIETAKMYKTRRRKVPLQIASCVKRVVNEVKVPVKTKYTKYLATPVVSLNL